MSMIHYYYGDGAGKTSAAVGKAVRAAAVMKVGAVQFLKDGTSGEIAGLKTLGIEVFACFDGVKFISRMTPEEKAQITSVHTKNLRAAVSNNYGLLILDELEDTYRAGLIDTALVKSILTSPPCELIITGHKPTEPFISAADYITHFTNEKHPYSKGITARQGIEY